MTASHSTMLMAEPAADIDQPRSTSIEGPKLKIMAKPTLNRPHISPATISATRALRSSRTGAGVDPICGLNPGRRPVSRREENKSCGDEGHDREIDRTDAKSGADQREVSAAKGRCRPATS